MPDDVQVVDRAVRFRDFGRHFWPRWRTQCHLNPARNPARNPALESDSPATAGAGRESAGTRGQLVELLAEGVPGALQLGAHQ